MFTSRLRLLVAAFVIGIGIPLAGCGGGGNSGGGPSGGGPSGNGTMGVFVTDNFGDQFSQVWVTLYKIEVSTDGTHFITVFTSDDPAGTAINVADLSQASQLLSSVSVPPGNYTQVRVTFGDHILLVPTNGGPSINAPVEGGVPIGNGQVTVTLAAHTPVASGQISNLVIDFDVASFVLVGGHVRPHIIEGDHGHFLNRSKRVSVHGVIAGLTSGGFDLLLRSGRTVHVVVNSQTSIFGEDNGAVVNLAVGQKVEVKGRIDATTHIITARRVIVDLNNPSGLRGVAHGTVASVDSVNHSFVITLDNTDHFTPTAGTLIVDTDANTVFKQEDHSGATFTDLTVGERVEVVGLLNVGPPITLLASRVELNEGND